MAANGRVEERLEYDRFGLDGVVLIQDQAHQEVLGANESDIFEATFEKPELDGDDGDREAGIDCADSVGIEAELAGLMRNLTHDLSQLAIAKLLPRAKELYERLHPETRHGGDRRKQIAESATCSFAAYAAKQSGICERTIYSRLKKAAELAPLDPEAEAACYGGRLSNQLSLVARIAQLPQPQLHRDIVAIHNQAGPKRATAELRKWEDHFAITKKPPRSKTKTSHDEAAEDDEPDAANADGDGDGAPVSTDTTNTEPLIIEILTALDVGSLDECVAAIEDLKDRATFIQKPADDEEALRSTARQFKSLLAESEKRRKKAEAELSIFQGTSLGEIFQTLRVGSAKEALRKVRNLMEHDHAAE